MQSNEVEVGLPQLQSAPIIAPDDANAHILYCPECAARLRLTGVSSPPKAPNRAATVRDRTRETLPGMAPASDRLAEEVACAVETAAARAVEDDEPTRIFRLSEIVAGAEQSPQGVAQVPPTPPPAEPPLAQPSEVEAATHRGDLAEDVDDGERTVAFVPSSIPPAPESQQSPVLSVAPITHEVAPSSSLRSKQGRGRVLGGLAAVSVLALGGWLYRAKSHESRELSQTSSRVSVSKVATEVVLPEAGPPKLAAEASSRAVSETQAAPSPEPQPAVAEVPQKSAAKTVSKASAGARAATAQARSQAQAKEATAAEAEGEAPGEEAPEATPEPTVGAFDSSAASAALDEAAGRATACRQADDPSGVAVVTLVFAPSGRVTTANISGPPFTGTATGSCIAKTMRTATVPPFAGDNKVVRKTVTIN